MNEHQWSPEVLQWLRAGWEPAFQVLEDPEGWTVYDAEMEALAVSSTKEKAEMIRSAVEFYNDEMERRRSAQMDAADT